MSNLIAKIDDKFILLADDTRIEINMSYDEYGNGTPCGWIITEAAQQSEQDDECHCNAEHAYMTYIPHEQGCPAGRKLKG